MGSLDYPLNQRGMDQACEAALVLRAQNFDTIISSPRKRALQTAEIVSEILKRPIVLEEKLVERGWGELEGKPYDSAKSLFDDIHTPKGGESFSLFQQRVLRALSSILDHKRQAPPLIVSHGGVFKALAHYLGYAELGIENCMPFLFRPSSESSSPCPNSWSVDHLTR